MQSEMETGILWGLIGRATKRDHIGVYRAMDKKISATISFRV